MSATTSPDAVISVETETPEEPKLLDHEYDGIQEYDNPLPGWWRAMFWGTIVFAASYYIWFQVAKQGKTIDEVYRAGLAEYDGKKVARAEAEAANVNEDMLAHNRSDPAVLQHGAAVFATRCASCHTADGHGLIGPNLTDGFQLHGSTRMDIYQTVHDGVPGTAMPAWGEQLPQIDIVAVAAFAISLRNTNVPGKEPQGHPVEAFK
jgi:cytochrome c oxidase cbb3-type subunit III